MLKQPEELEAYDLIMCLIAQHFPELSLHTNQIVPLVRWNHVATQLVRYSSTAAYRIIQWNWPISVQKHVNNIITLMRDLKKKSYYHDNNFALTPTVILLSEKVIILFILIGFKCLYPGPWEFLWNSVTYLMIFLYEQPSWQMWNAFHKNRKPTGVFIMKQYWSKQRILMWTVQIRTANSQSHVQLDGCAYSNWKIYLIVLYMIPYTESLIGHEDNIRYVLT